MSPPASGEDVIKVRRAPGLEPIADPYIERIGSLFPQSLAVVGATERGDGLSVFDSSSAGPGNSPDSSTGGRSTALIHKLQMQANDYIEHPGLLLGLIWAFWLVVACGASVLCIPLAIFSKSASYAYRILLCNSR